MKFLTTLLVLFTMSTGASASNFFTSVHMGSGESGRTAFVANSERSLADAKRKSLKMCKEKFSAQSCEALYSDRGEGYFVVVDGSGGAYGWAFNADRQAAINNAYHYCSDNGKVVCNKNASVVEPSLSKATVKKAESKLYPAAPKGQPGVTTCASKCINGDCYITYSTGEQKRVQVQQQFDINTKKWFSPSPKC